MEKLRKMLPKEFIDNLDPNLKIFAREIRKNLRDERDTVIAITGYPGEGKSNTAAILGMLVDFDYTFDKNICFIPTSKEITNSYMDLPMYSVLHIDEASRGLHKQRWYDKVQQTLNTLYDTEREGHFLCTLLLMPRFQNFTENFRNFRIKYWIHINERGLNLVYKKDEDKDAADPWHINENYKKKQKKWKFKKIFERSIVDIVKMEQLTENYWFYFKTPKIPEEIWDIYKKLKQESRNEKELEIEVESYKDKLSRERMERLAKIAKLKKEGKTHGEIGVIMNVAPETITRYVRQIKAYERMKGNLEINLQENKKEEEQSKSKENNTISNPNDKKVFDEIPEEFDKI